MVRACGVLCIFTSKCASRHNGVLFFHSATAKSGLELKCFVHFHFQICFAPRRRALFRHLNFHSPLYNERVGSTGLCGCVEFECDSSTVALVQNFWNESWGNLRKPPEYKSNRYLPKTGMIFGVVQSSKNSDFTVRLRHHCAIYCGYFKIFSSHPLLQKKSANGNLCPSAKLI